mmetsp:Transcript_45894/g.109303  ORF Transcript_45894/g.109303 Transcript_45894/m.109303 type:complete len:264 (-) Transcript_45894:109-900(-)
MGAATSGSPCLPALAARKTEIETGYWNFRGLGAPMRMICHFGGAQPPAWKDVKYDVTRHASRDGGDARWVSKEWEKSVKPTLKAQNPFVSLPYVLNRSTGEVVSQSNAVYLYLGRLFGLNGQTQQEQIANEQVLFQSYSLWLEVVDLVYPFKLNKDAESFHAALDVHLARHLATYYDKFEDWLQRTRQAFFCGDRPCTADFHVWEMLDQHEQMAERFQKPSPLRKYQYLQVYYEKVRGLPRLQAYFTSEDSRLPVNNKMAFFQ